MVFSLAILSTDLFFSLTLFSVCIGASSKMEDGVKVNGDGGEGSAKSVIKISNKNVTISSTSKYILIIIVINLIFTAQILL